MNSRDFCYWLQGLLEVGKPQHLVLEQINIIQRHLNMVFVREIDPSFPAELQDKLNEAHKKPNTNPGASPFPPKSNVLSPPATLRC